MHLIADWKLFECVSIGIDGELRGWII